MDISLYLFLTAIFSIPFLIAAVNAVRYKKWLWFVLILLMWPVTFLYLLFAYEKSDLVK